MNAVITIAQIKNLAAEVSQALQKENIHCLIYGSFAYHLYTQESIAINDIDIIVSSNSFPLVEKALSKMPFKLYVSEKSIHANHQSFLGNDDKPFDISFDSFEKYFQPQGFDLENYTDFEIDSTSVHLMTITDLIKLYKYSLTQGNNEKFKEYDRKIKVLENP